MQTTHTYMYGVDKNLIDLKSAGRDILKDKIIAAFIYSKHMRQEIELDLNSLPRYNPIK